MNDLAVEPRLQAADFDPMDPATQQCPHAWYAALRTQAPVHFVASRGLWLVTSQELVYEALRQPALFSSRFGRPQSAAPPDVAGEVAAIEAGGWPYVPTLLTEDPPGHNRYRRLVSRAFTARHVQDLAPAIEKIVAGLLDDALARTEVEFVADFAAPLPLTVIARMLGVREERQADFKRWSGEITLTIGGDVDGERHVERARQVLEFQRYFAAELERRRTEPADDLLTRLVQAHLSKSDADDEPLSMAACLAIVTQLLVAGNETTTKLLTGTMHLLATQPGWWAWLQADPAARAEQLAEEALRYLSPVQGMFRILTGPATLGGVELPAGARVVLSFAAANRDPAVFPNPEDFYPERGNRVDHLAFGHGTHYCLGAPLARLEATIALREIGRRVAAVLLSEQNDYRYQPSFLLRGLERLYVRLDPA